MKILMLVILALLAGCYREEAFKEGLYIRCFTQGECVKYGLICDKKNALAGTCQEAKVKK